jgi:hypothetical protein
MIEIVARLLLAVGLMAMAMVPGSDGKAPHLTIVPHILSLYHLL